MRKLNAMFVAFEDGNKAIGRKIAWDIYNSKLEKLRWSSWQIPALTRSHTPTSSGIWCKGLLK